VESILFAAEKSIKIPEIIDIIADEDLTTESIQDVINSLMQFYEERGGGFRLEQIRGGGFQFRTVAAAGGLMERMFSSRPRPISRAAQETLSIVAYRQPVTRADVEFIRGVDAGSIMKNLLERDLIKCVGRKEDAGRPMLFGTSDEFLRVYQLSSIKDLPPLDSFQPSSETIEGAAEALEGEQQVDIEDFIKDADKDIDKEDAELGLEGAESEVELSEFQDEDEFSEDNEGPLIEENKDDVSKETIDINEVLAVEGATVIDDDQNDECHEDLALSADEALLEKEDDIDGTNALTEVGISTGDSLPEGSGEMD
jgi:segregation and condensation protein B